MCRINESANCIIKRTATSDVHTTSELHSVWIRALYSIVMSQWDSVIIFQFIIIFLFVITTDVFSLK